MCGITGFIDHRRETTNAILEKMVLTLKHRGPDDLGINLIHGDCADIGLGHTRLAILDLSPSGHQPMSYKHLTVVFNGEIYNYEKIKEELASLGHSFTSTSDTEMILHAFAEWGAECVHRFIGMFAFVIYDKSLQKVYMFRDRAGVKPLFYYQNDDVLLFASELKAIMKHPSFEKEINHGALKLYFDYGYVPEPYSIFEKTYKLESGHYLEYNTFEKELIKNTYWSATDFYRSEKLNISYQQAQVELHDLLKSAFSYRLVSDVPVGIFLSGGYDSTAVAAILQNGMTKKLNTFTIGFEGKQNEAPYAKAIADYLGTNHHEYICTSAEAQQIIPELPYYYDEPFADSSAIPTILVSKFARQHVTVALSADAGDELFAGYNTYRDFLNNLWWLNKIPGSLKEPISRLIKEVATFVPESKVSLKHKIEGVSVALNKNRLQQAADLFRVMHDLPSTYLSNLLLKNGKGYKTEFNIMPDGFLNEAEIALAVDYKSYLPNDILTKVDRATMSVSLEGRDPLVDHRLLEFVARLPFEYKYDGFTAKKLLKDIVHQYVPREMMNRPKMGFSLPIYSWLRQDLSYLLDRYLNKNSLAESGLLNHDFILVQVDKFKQNDFHYSPLIWKILMFQMWYDEWM